MAFNSSSSWPPVTARPSDSMTMTNFVKIPFQFNLNLFITQVADGIV